MKKLLLLVGLVIFLTPMFVSAETIRKQPGVKLSDTRKQIDHNSTGRKQPGIKFSDSRKQSDFNETGRKQSGVKFSDSQEGSGRSNDSQYYNNNQVEKKLFGEVEIDNKDLSNSGEGNQNLDQTIDLKNKLIVDTSLGCKKPNDSSGSCENVAGVFVGLKKENKEKLRKIQIMLRLINYELENGYVGNNREYKSSTNIRGVLDGATKVQLFSYLKSKGESIDDFPFSFTVAGWKLEKKMKKKEKRKLASTIFDKVLPMLETDLKNNGISDCTYLPGQIENKSCSDLGRINLVKDNIIPIEGLGYYTSTIDCGVKPRSECVDILILEKYYCENTEANWSGRCEN